MLATTQLHLTDFQEKLLASEFIPVSVCLSENGGPQPSSLQTDGFFSVALYV